MCVSVSIYIFHFYKCVFEGVQLIWRLWTFISTLLKWYLSNSDLFLHILFQRCCFLMTILKAYISRLVKYAHVYKLSFWNCDLTCPGVPSDCILCYLDDSTSSDWSVIIFIPIVLFDAVWLIDCAWLDKLWEWLYIHFIMGGQCVLWITFLASLHKQGYLTERSVTIGVCVCVCESERSTNGDILHGLYIFSSAFVIILKSK